MPKNAPTSESFNSLEALVSYIQAEAVKLHKQHKGWESPMVSALAIASVQAEYRS